MPELDIKLCLTGALFGSFWCFANYGMYLYLVEEEWTKESIRR